MSTDNLGSRAKYEIVPPLSAEQDAALEKSIRENGVLTQVVVDEHGNIIDGLNRQRIAKKLGKPVERRTAPGLTEAEKVGMALTLNVDRRHLIREQRRELVAKSLRADPELSDGTQSRSRCPILPTGLDDITRVDWPRRVPDQSTGTDRNPMEDNHFQLTPERIKRLGLFISVIDTAELLGCTTRTVRQMIADGRLVGYKLSARFVRLRRDEVIAAMVPFGGAA